MKEYRLNWKGPFRWFGKKSSVVFEQPEAKKPGIYLFTFRHKNGFLIYCAGRTNKSFNSRLFDHAKNYLSGIYNVLDPEMAEAGKRHVVCRWIGYGGYSPEKWKLLNRFLQNYPKNAQRVYAQLQAMRVFIAPLKANRRVLERIEGAIMNILEEEKQKNPNGAGALPDPDMSLRPRRTTEKIFTVRNKGKARFHGLRRSFEA
jgi:hypothetical protein